LILAIPIFSLTSYSRCRPQNIRGRFRCNFLNNLVITLISIISSLITFKLHISTTLFCLLYLLQLIIFIMFKFHNSFIPKSKIIFILKNAIIIFQISLNFLNINNIKLVLARDTLCSIVCASLIVTMGTISNGYWIIPSFHYVINVLVQTQILLVYWLILYSLLLILWCTYFLVVWLSLRIKRIYCSYCGYSVHLQETALGRLTLCMLVVHDDDSSRLSALAVWMDRFLLSHCLNLISKIEMYPFNRIINFGHEINFNYVFLVNCLALILPD